jgi:hypothetical protein
MRIRFLLLALTMLVNIGHRSFAGGEYPLCKHTYFKGTKKVSTSLCYDKDNRFGKATAYNRKGEIIYEKSLRKIAGHSSVTFSYYSDGAVSKACYSDAPDAGIQWYKSDTWFKNNGTIDHVTEQSNDMRPMMSPKTWKDTGEQQKVGK